MQTWLGLPPDFRADSKDPRRFKEDCRERRSFWRLAPTTQLRLTAVNQLRPDSSRSKPRTWRRIFIKSPDTFRKVCHAQVVEDGLVFDAESVQGASIREDHEYDGVRITLTAFLGNARIPMQIDIGFGDTITPGVEAVEFPLMLTIPVLPEPKLNAYPRETVIAEKVEAMGMANSRMKESYDLFTLAQNFPFDGTVIVRAVQNTFERRATTLPHAAPLALTEEFSTDAAKTSQWRNFHKRLKIHASEPDLAGDIQTLPEKRSSNSPDTVGIFPEPPANFLPKTR